MSESIGWLCYTLDRNYKMQAWRNRDLQIGVLVLSGFFEEFLGGSAARLVASEVLGFFLNPGIFWAKLVSFFNKFVYTKNIEAPI